MSRYQNTKRKTTKLKRGKEKPTPYELSSNATTIYSSIPESDGDIYVVSQLGDRLDLLAHQFYGDVTLWWYIAKANNLKYNNLPEGIQLRIPGTLDFT